MNPLSWGLQTKAIVLLSLALAGSLAVNAVQLKSAWVGYGKRLGEANLAQVKGELDGFKVTDKINTAIAGQKSLDTTALLASLDEIAQRGQQTHTIYLRAKAKAPLPAACFPGQERMDAVNAGLSGQLPPPGAPP